ncbi:hypothetical protein PybrP1_001372 [[Pythium] brassicae (nom. inval.)]|nr:hypothetical protein PybrP1_001372 [[Pythium] brassicae (nom. inval.)]
MGGAVSELRHDIHAHVVIAKHYPTFLEPLLVVVQFFLRTAETGEGADPDRPVDEIPTDVVISDKRVFEEASTEVELLTENAHVMRTLLHAIETHRTLTLAPDLDPLKRWYDPPWRKEKPMPRFFEISPSDVPRFQIAVLRTSIRCLRLMMFVSDARRVLEELNGLEILNRAVLENVLDDFVKTDVKAIFSAVYGGENAVRRIAIGNVQVVVEMMKENLESAIVQLAGARRLCQLLSDANAMLYSPLAPLSAPDGQAAAAAAATALFRDIDTFGAVELVTSMLRRFDVERYLSLYLHTCRFISVKLTLARLHFAERNAKLAGQHGGVEGAIDMLFQARAMQREKKQAECDAAARQNRLLASANADWNSILETGKTQAAPPLPPALADGSSSVSSLASLAVVDFTPTEIGQLALWALDLLATLDFNVAQMKLHRLKYLLEEIRLDPDGRELGEALIVTRRLRLVRWDQVGLPTPTATSGKRKHNSDSTH